jgi:23S rRNA (pseudouridine1915-N3)-methyltransferase
MKKYFIILYFAVAISKFKPKIQFFETNPDQYMKLSMLAVGKTRVGFVAEGLSFYGARIQKYFPWEMLETTDVKHIPDVKAMVRTETGKTMKMIAPGDYVILLDEKGKQHTSLAFSLDLRKVIDSGSARRILFVIAGAYGAGDELKQRANEIWALSKLTFPHQLVRLILAEQIYRAMTIMRNEPYHHEG